MARSTRAAVAFLLVALGGCQRLADPDPVDTGASAATVASATSATSATSKCVSQLGPALAALESAVAAFSKEPTAPRRQAVQELLDAGELAVEGEHLVLAQTLPPPVESDALRRASLAELDAAIADEAILSTCKLLRATRDLAPGTLAERLAAATSLAAERARREAFGTAGATDGGSDAGGAIDASAIDAGAATRDGGASEAGPGATPLPLCVQRPRPRLVIPKEDLDAIAPRSRLYLDGGSGLGITWGIVGRELDSGDAIGFWGGIDDRGTCFFGIGGALRF